MNNFVQWWKGNIQHLNIKFHVEFELIFCILLMIPRSDKELLGPDNLHLPKIIEVFTEVNSSCFSFCYDEKIILEGKDR
jgi:hypothetical protein